MGWIGISEKSLFWYLLQCKTPCFQSDIGSSDIRLVTISLMKDIRLSAYLWGSKNIYFTRKLWNCKICYWTRIGKNVQDSETCCFPEKATKYIEYPGFVHCCVNSILHCRKCSVLHTTHVFFSPTFYILFFTHVSLCCPMLIH
jgi:hypothetical protein